METIFVSAAVAGAAICPLTAPLVTVKITQQVCLSHTGRRDLWPAHPVSRAARLLTPLVTAISAVLTPAP